MKQISISEGEAGQRLDKLLARYMKDAPKSFFYKMLRKKNITLNGKKAEGKELLKPGDEVKLFLSDETWEKFGGISLEKKSLRSSAEAVSLHQSVMNSQVPLIQDESGREMPTLEKGIRPPKVLYQDAHILLINKPAGMLSQKSAVSDVSLVEYLNACLLQSGAMTAEELQLVHPAVCNRLDRNTSGLVVAGISLAGLQTMNRLLASRTAEKYYRCIVCGTMQGSGRLRGYLKKDERTNTVTVFSEPTDGARTIETGYEVVSSNRNYSLLEVHLITGRSHQIRAHLASIGHPILGDPKYGDTAKNRTAQRSYGVRSQLLHAYRLKLPDIEGPLSCLSGKTFFAPVPEIFDIIMRQRV
ncbi:MAG: RluA family pseudouridine synthase [Lachnospiraceae bacterium]|nr:RluA family pseudouridine synthase [Lachnospiraceae bacterium]